ncbi:MAG: cytochrome b/b6 domain-containing protein [Rhodoplanes sp.]|uniref:cytochrome b/b6 domain-containing protein n=1 Tax=Rhodoplanes sp. TaxID=1968906 RepID=UPI0017DB00A1|nr:cytochrome b/b6 domain-containing protein [Rhodoplanes sp.]NVO16518.1 cytochrome b/b6 domain-containing protein [Rhodoplanes sp.]
MSTALIEIPARHRPAIHPLTVRVTHWINALAMTVMIMSGLAIHNAYPILPVAIPDALTLGGWLGGATRWHFAAMWLLAGNGLVYLAYGIVSGRFRRKLLPITPRAVLADLRDALSGRLGHADLSVYNAVQRLLYLGVILAGLLAVLSGLAIWKPVQLGGLTALMGDFDNARLVHFAAMAAIVTFLLVHVAMALLVPRSLKAMVVGR